MRPRSRLSTWFAMAGLAAALAGCPKSSTPVAPADGTPVTPGAAGDAGGSGALVALAPVEHPQQLMPSDTLFMMEGKSVNRAAKVLERDRLVKSVPDVYADLKRGLEREFGYDIADPAVLASMGIDPDGRFGLAVLDVRREAFMVYATVSDAGKLREAVLSAAARSNVEIRPTSLGGAEILRDKYGRIAVVIREPFVAMIQSRGTEEGDLDFAQAIATMDPSQSLAANREYRKASAGIVGADVLSFANFAGMMTQLIGDRAPSSDRRKAEHDLAQLLAGGMPAAVARFDAKPGGPVVEGRILQGEGDFPRSLVRNGTGTPPLAQALNGSPLLLAAGNLEVDAAIDLFDRTLRTEGKTYHELNEKLRDKTGVDVNATIRPLLTGVAGAAMTFDGKPSTDNPSSHLGVAVHFEVTDPAKAAAALDGLGKKLEVDGRKFKKDRATGLWALDFPTWRKLYVGMGGKHIVITSDPSLPGRLASGKGGNISRKLKPAGAYAAMSMQDQAMTWAADFGGLGGWFLFGMASMPMHVPGPAAGVPQSREFKRKQAELKKLTKKLKKMRAQRESKQVEAIMAATQPFGMSVLVAKEQPDGIVVQGGQFYRTKGFGELVETVARKFKELDAIQRPPAEMDELSQKVFKLQDELQQIQARDTLKAQARKKRGR